MSYILLRTTLATVIAFAGGALGVALGRVTTQRLSILVYAAMGALLSVTLCDVLPDAKETLSWPVFLMGTVSGFGLFWVIGKYVSHVCAACAIGSLQETTTLRIQQSVILLLIALGLHSTMDGIAVAVGDTITGHPNIGVLFAVSFHKFPEGLALALLLIGAGYARRTALFWTLGIETLTELGGLVGVLALQGASHAWLGVLFAHVGGGFLYLVASTIGLPDRRPFRFPARALVISSTLSFFMTTFLLWALAAHAK